MMLMKRSPIALSSVALSPKSLTNGRVPLYFSVALSSLLSNMGYCEGFSNTVLMRSAEFMSLRLLTRISRRR